MRHRTIFLLFIAATLAAGKVAIARRIESRAAIAPYDFASLPSVGTARWLSLSHPTLVANIYWLRAIQYMGDPNADARGWGKLFPVLDLITDLDPRHGYAYQVGGNLLAAAGQIDESNRLLEKGTASVRDRYILPFHRGVNALLYAGDYALAGKWFEHAARAPGAPLHVREAVMALYVKGDQVDTAIRFLDEMLAQTEDAETRRALEAQRQQARLEQVAHRIDAAVASYRERFHRLPGSLEELTRTGVVEGIPPDPYGGSWVIDEEGRVHSTVNGRRLVKPQTPAERMKSIEQLRSRLKGSASR